VTDGRFTERTQAGPFTGARGYDGRTAWQEDAKGVVLAQNGPEATADTANEIFVTTDRLFAPARGGADVSYLGTRTDGGNSYEAISIKPSNGYPFERWFDTCHWAARQDHNDDAWADDNHRFVELSQYQRPDGAVENRHHR
jgi:hypothetical protein